MRHSALFPFLLAFGACVSLEQLPPGTAGAPSVDPSIRGAQSFPDIDPGGTSLSSLHFTLKGYTEADIRPISVTAENLYNKIGSDTGLYSFLASGSYTIVVYRDREEYIRKTHQPDWSRAVATGGSIYLYPGSDLEPVLAHEMTHLIFNSYLQDKAASYRWLNEGLAMYEEFSLWPESSKNEFRSSSAKQLRENRMAFSQMTFFVPATEERRMVDVWYQQVKSVTEFLLAQGSALNFANMLGAIKSGSDIDTAIANNYPGKFRNLSELEVAWKYTV
jgi:hypothetical protein